MSIEVVKLFTSSGNISYLKVEISKQITDERIKEAILETLTESVFDFQSYTTDGQLRHSSNTKDEVTRLNNEFINDRLSFAKNFNIYADKQEFYADQMFIDDSLRPGPYSHFNDDIDSDQRIFRYQDKHDKNRSSIPIWQVNKRGNTDYFNNDELRESDISQIRKATEAVVVDHINTLPICKRPQWIDN